MRRSSLLWLGLLALPACNREALDGMNAPDGGVGVGADALPAVADLTLASADFSMVMSPDLVTVPMGPGLNGGTSTSYNASANPNAIVIGDFNGDGRQDVALAATGDGVVDVFLGDGNGGLAPFTTWPVSSHPAFLAVGRIDGDATLDLVTLDADDGTLSILLGNGDGSFQQVKLVAAGASTSGLTLADMDRDGKLDVAVGNVAHAAISFFHGDGAGGFAGPTDTLLASSAAPFSLAAADFDRDGNSDLVVGFYGSNDSLTTQVWRGKGDGTFANNQGNTYSEVGHHLVVVADLNGDAWPDILCAQTEAGDVFTTCNPNGFGVRCSGGSNFVDPVGLAVADFDGDGHADVVSANEGDASLGLMLGAGGQGNPTLGKSIHLDSPPSAVATADLDGDGRSDLVVAETFASRLVVLLNGK